MEPEPCTYCKQLHTGACATKPDKTDAMKVATAEYYKRAFKSAAEIRAQFSQYLKNMKENEAAIDKSLKTCENFTWHLCIWNRLFWGLGLRELGILTPFSSSNCILTARLAACDELYL
jgi:hypothetical protein